MTEERVEDLPTHRVADREGEALLVTVEPHFVTSLPSPRPAFVAEEPQGAPEFVSRRHTKGRRADEKPARDVTMAVGEPGDVTPAVIVLKGAEEQRFERDRRR